ncbi:hypothetical protein QQF64_009562 [Cirrhinus molitorella]|uniref:ribonuclease H n=1 Tax=Cirrhinus molitorella TaxID=172907 RepID=A0ABR3M309_9TELE
MLILCPISKIALGCKTALGGNLLFSSMDLTSGFYNIPLHVSDRHYTAFTTQMELYEYNCLPQGLCNSPASFMRMMLSIFGDLNFSSLLCYLDDLLVFARSEQEALTCLEVVFSRLRTSNLKLSPNKCHFLKFLGHVISSSGVSVDEDKVAVISAFQKKDLMKDDGSTPSGHGSLLSKLHPWMVTYRKATVQFDCRTEMFEERHKQS